MLAKLNCPQRKTRTEEGGREEEKRGGRGEGRGKREEGRGKMEEGGGRREEGGGRRRYSNLIRASRVSVVGPLWNSSSL